jgi:hypothetical protein
LDIGSNLLTDHDLEVLSAFGKLEELAIHSERITGSGLKHIPAPVRLRRIQLQLPELSDQGVSWIWTCENVRVLTIGNRPLSAEVMSGIVRLKHLEVLSLPGSIRQEACIRHIAELPRLETLFLFYNAVISDRVTDLLLGLPSLGHLDIRGTSITCAGIAKIREKRPNVFVAADDN